MNQAIAHVAEEGGFRAEVPALPGCLTQGETLEELVSDLHEAIAGCLASIWRTFDQRDLDALTQ